MKTGCFREFHASALDVRKRIVALPSSHAANDISSPRGRGRVRGKGASVNSTSRLCRSATVVVTGCVLPLARSADSHVRSHTQLRTGGHGCPRSVQGSTAHGLQRSSHHLELQPGALGTDAPYLALAKRCRAVMRSVQSLPHSKDGQAAKRHVGHLCSGIAGSHRSRPLFCPTPVSQTLP